MEDVIENINPIQFIQLNTVNIFHSFLISEYNKTKFPFFGIIELINLGAFKKELTDELLVKKIIRKRKGFNGDLIELLVNNLDSKS